MRLTFKLVLARTSPPPPPEERIRHLLGFDGFGKTIAQFGHLTGVL
ncbi:MAG: hypothetical protein JNM56_06335 [Planctomycetia bacterium]|nr:hypothetical protein [Planctomycetia bacterium]